MSARKSAVKSAVMATVCVLWSGRSIASELAEAPQVVAPVELKAGPMAEQKIGQPDALSDASYLPGYRFVPGLGQSPFAPRVGALPGGVTPSFMAPTSSGRWTLRFWGYLSASAQYGINDRLQTQAGQSSTILHAPPATIEEYASFTSVNAIPGHWVQMYFSYGNRNVSVVVRLSTWNPSEPTTYYQLGSQNFLDNAYVAFRIPEVVAKLRLSSKAGYFYNQYGQLGRYDLGMYQNPIAAVVRGVGATFAAEYDLTPRFGVFVEEGLMGNRNGKAPSGLTRQNPNGNTDPFFPSSYIQHAHLGLIHHGNNTTVKAQLHHIFNWAMDDRPQVDTDNMVTRGLDESYIRDAKLSVYAAELSLVHPAYGHFAIAGSRLDATHAYVLKGVQTFGGEGQDLTDRWLGDETYGSGTVDVLAFNYAASLLAALSWPTPREPNKPDLVINVGGTIAVGHDPTSSELTKNPVFDGRWRYKAGLDVLYVVASWFGAAVRVDRVVPNHRDSEESFYVLAPRLLFKTNWASRENITLKYVKWFYGAHSHAEYSAAVPPRLDDQLISLNANMWW